MKNSFLLFISFIFVGQIFAQFENRYWIMGYSNFSGQGFGGFSVDFLNNNPDTVSVDRVLNIAQGTSNISTKDGRFLFVTNGARIGDASNQIMLNGDSLLCLSHCSPQDDGSNLYQCNIIIPDPGDTSKYFLFYSTGELYQANSYGSELYPLHVYYAEIDMTLNGGLGAVTKKNIPLVNDLLNLGKLTACKHANGRDWWLVFQKYSVPVYYTYLITPYGIQFVSTQWMGLGGYMPGTACFSPDGLNYLSFDFIDGLQVFSFDRCTGLFSNPRYASYNASIVFAFGAEFSTSSRYVYICNSNYIYQYDLQAPIFELSKRLVGIWDGSYDIYPFSTQFFTMSLARDGKIYIISGNGNHYIHRIEFPDSAGVACHFQQRYVKTPRWYWRAVPNEPNYQLTNIPGSVCDTTNSINDLVWDFSMEIYPNPVHLKEKVFIEYSHVGEENGNVEICNLTGSVVYSGMTSSYTSIYELSIPALSSGVYIVRMKFRNAIQSRKLIIN